MSSITLNTKVYNGVGFNGKNMSVFKNTSAGLPSGFSYLTTAVNTATGGKPSTVRWNLSLPHIAVEPSACACPGGILGTDYVRFEVSASATSTPADRVDLYLRIKDLVLSAEFKASIEDLTQST